MKGKTSDELVNFWKVIMSRYNCSSLRAAFYLRLKAESRFFNIGENVYYAVLIFVRPETMLGPDGGLKPFLLNPTKIQSRVRTMGVSFLYPFMYRDSNPTFLVMNECFFDDDDIQQAIMDRRYTLEFYKKLLKNYSSRNFEGTLVAWFMLHGYYDSKLEAFVIYIGKIQSVEIINLFLQGIKLEYTFKKNRLFITDFDGFLDLVVAWCSFYVRAMSFGHSERYFEDYLKLVETLKFHLMKFNLAIYIHDTMSAKKKARLRKRIARRNKLINSLYKKEELRNVE